MSVSSSADMRSGWLVLIVCCVVCSESNAQSEAQAGDDKNGMISYSESLLNGDASSHIRTIDVRPESQCLESSIENALCLPLEHILADNHRLANFSGIVWLLGTAGMSGLETIQLVGDSSVRKEFLAGLLYLLGQNRVVINDQPIGDYLGEHLSSMDSPVKGHRRGTVRSEIYQPVSRLDQLVLKSELVDTMRKNPDTVIVDVRSESDYWGRRIVANRGGHIPGAILHREGDVYVTHAGSQPILYGQNFVDGLAQLARFIASGTQVRLYGAGWAEWSADSQLSVDALSYPTASTSSVTDASLREPSNTGESNASTRSEPVINHPLFRLMILLNVALLFAVIAVIVIRFKQGVRV